MRQDRIIPGELRGGEAYTFLRAINTGHPGSMTTIHADSPSKVMKQLALIILQRRMQLKREDIRHYVRSTVDIFVQPGCRNGKRIVGTIARRGEISIASDFSKAGRVYGERSRQIANRFKMPQPNCGNSCWPDCTIG